MKGQRKLERERPGKSEGCAAEEAQPVWKSLLMPTPRVMKRSDCVPPRITALRSVTKLIDVLPVYDSELEAVRGFHRPVVQD